MTRKFLSVLVFLLATENPNVSLGSPQTSNTGQPTDTTKGTRFPFEILMERQRIRTRNAKVALIHHKPIERPGALRIDFEPAERPQVSFPPGVAGESAADWRSYGALVLDLTNPTDEEVSYAVRIDDDDSANDAYHSRTARSTLGPRESHSLSVAFGPSDPLEHGMRAGPTAARVSPPRSVAGGPIDATHVTGFQIFLSQPLGPRTLILNGVRLLPLPSYDAIVDEFGQYTRADWPSKVKQVSEFKGRKDDEEGQIRSTNHLPGLRDRDAYGGWAQGPKLEASGFFRTLLSKGKWWLVTPDGHLFFSLGMDVIDIHEGYTLVEGRERMFTWLPEQGQAMAKHYSYADHIIRGPIRKGQTFNFYTANLERKYGADYLSPWRAMAVDRLLAWGFNTIGNWSDPKLYDLKRVPYTATIGIRGDFARVSSGSDYWGKMPDPFDPKFALAADRSIHPVVEQHRDDPWCVGYFVDNEISWAGGGGDRGHYGLAYGAASGGATLPAKQALVDQLRHHYGEIKQLNAAWGTNFPSWDTFLNQSFQPPELVSASMKEDFSAFLKAFARQYFRLVRDTLKKYDPNHLYLGCRFAWRTQEAVEASAEFSDVVSFNIYDRRLDPQRWDFTNALRKPCVIGEFHFGALDRGMFHPGLVSTPNQQARAAMYRDYVESVADHPAFVGCHWFEYVDEPLTGRALDGENYNIGFVDVTDTPYGEMVTTAKTVHNEIYTRRAK